MPSPPKPSQCFSGRVSMVFKMDCAFSSASTIAIPGAYEDRGD